MQFTIIKEHFNINLLDIFGYFKNLKFLVTVPNLNDLASDYFVTPSEHFSGILWRSHFDEMVMVSALFRTNMLSWMFIV